MRMSRSRGRFLENKDGKYRKKVSSPQTSKDVGVNVEGDLEAEEIVHTFALSEDENKSNDRNRLLTI